MGVLSLAIFKFQCVVHFYSEISLYDFHSKTDLVKGSNYTGMLECL